MNLDAIHVVLVRPRNPMNVGAIARAMKNFGLSRLTLVDPQTHDAKTARALAVHAREVLDGAARVDTLAEALSDASWVVGTRQHGFGDEPALSPAAVAEQCDVRTHQGSVALVFGCEQSGLSRAELLACHAVSSISTAPASAGALAQGSLNLAQAVVVYAHAIFDGAGAASGRAPDPQRRAPDADLQAIEDALREVLRAAQFAEPDRRGHGARELAHTLRRAGLSHAEARLWRAALHRMGQRLRALPG